MGTIRQDKLHPRLTDNTPATQKKKNPKAEKEHDLSLQMKYSAHQIKD